MKKVQDDKETGKIIRVRGLIGVVEPAGSAGEPFL